MLTGKFNSNLKNYFDAVDGAYTSMTEAEIDKGTFNVKANIRQLLVYNLTYPVLRSYNSSDNIAKFKVSDKVSGFAYPIIELVCKYSKPDKEEMTIYLNEKKGIPSKYLIEGYVWFIFFKADDAMPWFGIMADAQFISIKDDGIESLEFTIDELEVESNVADLIFSFDVNSVNVEEVNPPCKIAAHCKVASGKGYTLPHEKLKRQEKNKVIRGEKGEEVIMKIEKDKMISNKRPDLVDKIKWVAKETDGLGYDIESFELGDDGKEYKIFIEVKSTSGGKMTPFNISENEVRVSKEKGVLYFIYRIYNLSANGEKIKYYKVSGAIDNNFTLEPVVYKATIK